MNAEIRKARKKPIVIDVMVWPGGAGNATPVINWILENDGTARYHEFENGHTMMGEYWEHEEHIAIDTLEGTMKVRAGDVIARGVKGEFYPIAADIFRETYDFVSEGAQ